MLNKDELDRVDWDGLGYGGHLMRDLLINATDRDSEISTRALNNLENYLTPWPAFDTEHGNPESFKNALQNDIPHTVVPFLIDILADEALDTWVRTSVLEILHNMALYLSASRAFTKLANPVDSVYRMRARAIRDAVERGQSVYQALINHGDEALHAAAQDIVALLRD